MWAPDIEMSASMMMSASLTDVMPPMKMVSREIPPTSISSNGWPLANRTPGDLASSDPRVTRLIMVNLLVRRELHVKGGH